MSDDSASGLPPGYNIISSSQDPPVQDPAGSAELPPGYKIQDSSLPGKPMSLSQRAAESIAAPLETALHYGSSAIAPLGGGLTYLGTLAATRNPGAAQSVRADTENALTYQPGTEYGQDLTNTVGNTAKKVANYVAPVTRPIGNYVNNKIDELGAVSPVAGALTKGVIGAAPYALSLVGGGEGAAASETTAADVAAPSAENAALIGPRTSIGAAQVNPSPFALTGQEAGRGSAFFPQVKLAKNAGDVPASEQATRAGIVKEVLNDSGETDAGIRTGVLTGNEQTLRGEYQAAKNPAQTPANAVLADQISAEQRALPQFAQQRIDATDADPTLQNDYQRGDTINGAFFGNDGNSLTEFLNQTKKNVYQKANDQSGANPLTTDNVDSLLKDPQFNAGVALRGHENVVAGASNLINLAKTVGFKDPVTGEMYAPGSMGAFDAVRKAINSNWTPDNKMTVRAINGAIDQDFQAAGGAPLYKLGDKIHQYQQGLLTDSPGISKVFGEVDPNGVQTAKPFESIPKTLNDMPLDQWRHVHGMLDSLSNGYLPGNAPEGIGPIPDGLRQAATRAKAEVEGSLAREVYAQGSGNAGGWNSNSANQALNGRVGQKILDTFPPDEIRKYQVLNSAGQIMPGTHSYEGAGAQTARMNNEPGFVENYAPAAGSYVGMHVMGPVVGNYVGTKAGTMLSKISKGKREASHADNVRQSLRNNLNIGQPATTTTARASGGKVDHESLVAQLMTRWHAARKESGRATKPLLNVPDASIIRALDIAQEHI